MKAIKRNEMCHEEFVQLITYQDVATAQLVG